VLDEGIYGDLNRKVSDYYKNEKSAGGYNIGCYIIDVDSIMWINMPNMKRLGIIEWQYEYQDTPHSKSIPISKNFDGDISNDFDLKMTSCQIEEARWELLHDQHYVVIQILNPKVEKQKTKIDENTKLRYIELGLNQVNRKLEIKKIIDNYHPKTLGKLRKYMKWRE